MEQLRPRLTPEEINFIAKSLRTYEASMKQKRAEMEWRKSRINTLHRAVIGGPGSTHDRIVELKAQRAQLEEDKQQYHTWFMRELAARLLAKRFEALQAGGKRHSAHLTPLYLSEPNSP